MAREISGTTKQKDEQVYVYREDMSRHKIEEDWKPYILEWTSDIYQKTPRISLDFWYGREEEMGLKEKKVRENIENMNRGQGKIMPKPVVMPRY